MVKVLLTGATGSIGGAILRSLLAHGHSVNSIVRDQTKGEALAALGENSTFTLIDFNADTVDSIAALAKDYDVFIHNAYITPDLEYLLARAILVTGRQLESEGKPFQFIYTSGCLSIGPTVGPVDESYTDDKPYPFVTWRNPLDLEIIAAGTDVFVTTVARPTWVYPNSYVDTWARSVKTLGKVYYNQANAESYVPLIYLPDLGENYNLLVSSRSHGIFNVTDNHPLKIRDIVQKVKEITGVTEEEHFDDPVPLIEKLGNFAIALVNDQQVLTSKSLELGWQITQPNWLEAPHDF